MDEVRFVKGHGTENDFVLLPDPDGSLELTAELARAICDRRAGIGADGVLRVVRAAADSYSAQEAGDAEWFMDYRNADGSAVEMCGNGIRVFARYLVTSGLAPPGTLRIVTRGGVRDVRARADGDITVELGPYALPDLREVEVSIGDRTWPATAVTTPNPHVVAIVDDLSHAGDLREPPTVRPAAAYADGVNVELAQRLGRRHLAMRVYERGVGETRSCGTGAAAAAVALLVSDRQSRDGAALDEATDVRVDVPGGRLVVTVRPDGSAVLTGRAVLVAAGTLSSEWLAAQSSRAAPTASPSVSPSSLARASAPVSPA